MNDRIKLAEAMGWKQDSRDHWLHPDGITAPLLNPPDPENNANDDYAVLEWAIKSLDPDAYFAALTEVVGSYAYLHEYRIGYFARAALKVMDGQGVSDIIKKAVELADGVWAVRDDGVISTPWWSSHMELHNRQWKQEELDALAAQLVRQVDSIDGRWVCVEDDRVAIYSASNVYEEEFNYSYPTRDRALNTITAIVESGVLEE